MAPGVEQLFLDLELPVSEVLKVDLAVLVFILLFPYLALPKGGELLGVPD